jgi:hypothetical protein
VKNEAGWDLSFNAPRPVLRRRLAEQNRDMLRTYQKPRFTQPCVAAKPKCSANYLCAYPLRAGETGPAVRPDIQKAI